MHINNQYNQKARQLAQQTIGAARHGFFNVSKDRVDPICPIGCCNRNIVFKSLLELGEYIKYINRYILFRVKVSQVVIFNLLGHKCNYSWKSTTTTNRTTTEDVLNKFNININNED